MLISKSVTGFGRQMSVFVCITNESPIRIYKITVLCILDFVYFSCNHCIVFRYFCMPLYFH